MTYDDRSKLGQNLNEIGKTLGLKGDFLPHSPEGDLGSIYLCIDHYLDAIREFRHALEDGWSEAAPPHVREEIRERLAWCYYWTGSFGEAEAVIEDMEDLGRERPGVLILEGRIALERGELERARERADQTVHISARCGCVEWAGPARSLLGIIAQRECKPEEARVHFEEALIAYRSADDPDGECRSYIHLGTLSKSECRWEEALRFLQRARNKAEDEGFYYLFGSAGLNLGNLRFRLGEYEEALAIAAESQRVFQAIGYLLGVTRSLIAQTRVHLIRGDRKMLRECLDKGAELSLSGRFKREQVLLEIYEGEAAVQFADRMEGERRLERALALAREICPTCDIAVTATLHLAQLQVQNEESGRARPLLRGIAEATRSVGDPAREGWLRRLNAETAFLERRLEVAAAEAAAAVQCFERIGYRRELAQALLVAARIAAATGCRAAQTERVLSPLLRAKRLWEDLHADRETAHTSLEIARYWLARRDVDEALVHAYRARQQFQRMGDARGLAESARLFHQVEERMAQQILGGRESIPHEASDTTGALEEGLSRLLEEAVSGTESARGWIASGRNGAELTILSTHRIDEKEAERVVGRLLAEDPGFLERERPLFCSGLSGLPHEGSDDSVVVVPFATGEGERALLYVDRPRGEDRGWYRLRDVQLLAHVAHGLSRLMAENRKTPLRAEDVYHEERLEGRPPFANIITDDRKMIDTLRIASRIASYPITVLIEGETGTGKQLLARAIHDTSDRRGGPFVTVSCASLPEQILESELFGYMKGAFTGAIKDRKGLFEEADGGTILLDEIGKAGHHVQRALLHVLDQGAIRPLGSNVQRRVDVRVICATSNMRLKDDIQEGVFLKDLYYRINDIALRLPPLRERISDVRLLADYFIEKFRWKANRPRVEFDNAIYAVLERYHWPGNVRELEKAVHRAVLLTPGGRITPRYLPEELIDSDGRCSGSLPLKDQVEGLERARIRECLIRNRGNRSQTARELGLSLRGLRNKIQRYRLEV